MDSVAVLIPYQQADAATARARAGLWESLASRVACIPTATLKTELTRGDEDIVVIHEPHLEASTEQLASLLGPLRKGQADAVFARAERSPPWAAAAVAGLARSLHAVPLTQPFSPLRAFRGKAVRMMTLHSDGEALDAELLSKLAAQQCRLHEVPLALQSDAGAAGFSTQWARARALIRYATTHNDADNLHEGYNTLARMEGAPHYNAWLGRRFRAHLGKRVLEVGAGIGTITRELEQGLELLIALEVEAFYVERLKNIFRDKPHVRPWLSDVSTASWEALAREQLDTVVLSNVLEHIEDDARAVRDFRSVLSDGGKLLVFVPALPALYGSMDEAVGHHRRYTREGLTRLLGDNGFKVTSVAWMNAVGIPGWFLNGRVMRRRAVPPLQLRAFDAVAPLLARLEDHWSLPVGMSLFAVAEAHRPC